MCAPSPPPAPDYAGAAREQGAANLEAAVAQGKINNPNVYSPYGTQKVVWGEPGTPTEHTPTLYQDFSPEQKALYDQSNKTKLLLGGLGEQGATSLQGLVGKRLDLAGLPALPSSGADTRNRIYAAMLDRVNQDTAIAKNNLNSDLIAAGIRPGSKAYDDRMHLTDRAYNDARNQAYLASGQEASREFGLDAERRRMALGELLASRQTPLNEITALLSGSQVANPFAMPGYAQNTQVAAAPIFAGTKAAGDWESGLYNAQTGYAGNLASGLFSLGGGLAYLGGQSLGRKGDRGKEG